MDKKIKVGVVGVGALGNHHARLYGECDKAELVGVYDVNKETANKIAKDYNTVAFDSMEKLAENTDGVSIAVPTDLHYDIVSLFLDLDTHVLVEKPITHIMEDARKLVDQAAEKDLILQVGHVERFNPVMTYLNEKIDNPRFIEVHRLAPYPAPRKNLLPRGTEVGVVLDLMIHDIDLVLHLVNRPIVDVRAVGIPVLSKTEDIGNARIAFDNGCVANLTASRVSPELMRKVRVFQGSTYLSLDYMNHTGEIYGVKGGQIKKEGVPVEKHNALQKELEDFIHCIADRKVGIADSVPKVSGEHGLNALKIALQITEQIKSQGV
ncbi:MAG: Gfo/Idh/MocA family oxidoreductase [Verrucomicrobiota bacterium]|nr:Gfo/Idh/MocA family oxidoreductase [Verrucomicrobiota bacterium]